jgi:plastocyanin
LVSAVTGASGQDTAAQEAYEDIQIYEYSVSNEELTLSIDKISYEFGETVEVIGLVHDLESKQNIYIATVTKDGTRHSEMRIQANDDGIYKVPINISGLNVEKIFVEARYGIGGIPVTIEAGITKEYENGIVIPRNAHVRDMAIGIEPENLLIMAGKKITWRNNDIVSHTMISGTPGPNGVLRPDGVFDTGLITAGGESQMFLEEGTYQYYDRFNPWITGSIQVTPSDESTSAVITETQSRISMLVQNAGVPDNWTGVFCSSCTSSIQTSLTDRKQGSSSIQLDITESSNNNNNNNNILLPCARMRKRG